MKTLYRGAGYELLVYADGGKIRVTVREDVPWEFIPDIPFSRKCDPRPRVWYKPWTWLRRDPKKAVRDALSLIKKKERRRKEGEDMLDDFCDDIVSEGVIHP